MDRIAVYSVKAAYNSFTVQYSGANHTLSSRNNLLCRATVEKWSYRTATSHYSSTAAYHFQSYIQSYKHMQITSYSTF